MDGDTAKSLASLLLWGALFFFMMRYGCGAHVLGGHRRHRTPGGDATDAIDPVCGMPVPPGSSSAAAIHQGRTYYFCSRSCRDKFESNPGRYAAGSAEISAQSRPRASSP